MIDLINFKLWMSDNLSYSKRTISNIASRFKRANSILEWFDNPIYSYHLEQTPEFNKLPADVKAQIKKAVKLYFQFVESKTKTKAITEIKNHKMKVLSLFANVGVAEAYLKRIGFDVVVANELLERRATLYSKIYPETSMVCGDITTDEVKERIAHMSLERGVDIIMATPPCQGMSTAGQQNEDDIRNSLICPVVDLIKKIKPRYVFIENVPLFYSTKIEIDGELLLIPDYLERELSENYIITKQIINTKDYSVPQTRERAITLLSKRGEPLWEVPQKDERTITLYDAIGNLPILDPFVTDVTEEKLLELFPHFYERREEAKKISTWHNPPHHVMRQVVAMQHTPTGCTAFDNPVYVPTKNDGTPVKGYHNTSKRPNWDTPAYTVTMDNRKISSQNNVHPGRLEYINEKGEEIYSDPRTLTLYELMIVSSLPSDWPVPANTSEAFLRRIIGEGIPPLFVKKVFEKLKEVQENG